MVFDVSHFWGQTPPLAVFWSSVFTFGISVENLTTEPMAVVGITVHELVGSLEAAVRGFIDKGVLWLSEISTSTERFHGVVWSRK